jgi:4-amino-4-deoxy-L-arabinose transferase-like glycosyltransferase
MPHLARARMANLLFLTLALVCTIVWGLRFGRGVALLAAAMLASLPPILGHAGVATTDMAVAATLPLALLAFERWLRERTYRNALLAGGAIGLGALSKFSFVLFFPVSLLALLLARRPRLEAKRTAIGVVISACTAFLLIWAGYRFTFGTSDTWPNLPMPAPGFLHGLTIVQRHNALGHDSYLFGSVHHFGWWYYFPAVFFFKTPLPFLLLAGIGVAVIATCRRDALDLVLIPAALMLSVLPSTINIGIRHLLPIYPPLCVVAAIGAAALWRLGNRHGQLTTDNRQPTSTTGIGKLYLNGARAVAVAAGVWLFGGVALAHPDYLAWFNEAAGRHPERIAVDSNLDWGQDALRLRRFVRQQHIPEIFLFCYDTAPIDHGINLPPARKAHGWVAVGETLIHIDPYARAGAYDWLREYEPVGRIGTSIRLYHIP